MLRIPESNMKHRQGGGKRGCEKTFPRQTIHDYNRDMCGRFTLRTPTPVLLKQFEIATAPPLTARYNIAPTQDVAVIRLNPRSGEREIALLRWGLVPFWADDPGIGSRMINARSETAGTKPAFRQAMRKRRCFVLADGYYEWDGKRPYWIRRADEAPFAMAGLWESWSGAGGFHPDQPLESCTILTTDANTLTRDIHDRMPVILDRIPGEQWLDHTIDDPAELQPLLRPYNAKQMQLDLVNSLVNNARNEDPRCIEIQRELF